MYVNMIWKIIIIDDGRQPFVYSPFYADGSLFHATNYTSYFYVNISADNNIVMNLHAQ